jgi:branched-chain amino acid transport system substrate-binding protein
MKNYKEFSGIEPTNPAADRSYDAGAIVGLAIAQAGKAESAAIKDAIREFVVLRKLVKESADRDKRNG